MFRARRGFGRSKFRCRFDLGASTFIVQHREHLIDRGFILLRVFRSVHLRDGFDQGLVPVDLAVGQIRVKVLHRSPNSCQANKSRYPRIFRIFLVLCRCGLTKQDHTNEENGKDPVDFHLTPRRLRAGYSIIEVPESHAVLPLFDKFCAFCVLSRHEVEKCIPDRLCGRHFVWQKRWHWIHFQTEPLSIVCYAKIKTGNH